MKKSFLAGKRLNLMTYLKLKIHARSNTHQTNRRRPLRTRLTPLQRQRFRRHSTPSFCPSRPSKTVNPFPLSPHSHTINPQSSTKPPPSAQNPRLDSLHNAPSPIPPLDETRQLQGHPSGRSATVCVYDKLSAAGSAGGET